MELYIPPKYEFYKYNPANGRFLKGHIPWNKGEKMRPDIYEKCKPTMFKKGNISTRKYNTTQKHQKPVEMYHNDRIIGFFESINKAQRKTGIWRENIRKVIKGERKRAGGFEWKLVKT